MQDSNRHQVSFHRRKLLLKGYVCIIKIIIAKLLTYAQYYLFVLFQRENFLNVSWKKCADLPITISAPQVVSIGDNVYVGGGYRKHGATKTVFRYSLSQDTWTPLPHCLTHQYGLTTLDGKLIAVGGVMSTEVTSSVLTFSGDLDTWKQDLPPMLTPRYLLSTMSHDNRLIIAAGGITNKLSNGDYCRTDAVEVYIKDCRQWHSTLQLPFPTCVFSMSIVDGKCYILGGGGGFYHQSSTTLYATVTSLLENAMATNKYHSIPHLQLSWKKLKEKHPLICSSLVEMDGRVTAMGGSHKEGEHCGTKFISTYQMPGWSVKVPSSH